MALAISEARSPSSFDRHIKRLLWCALIGSLALLIPVTYSSTVDNSGLISGLGAAVVVIATLAVARDVSRYVRAEAGRRAEASRRSSRLGACRAAEAIQDRVANLLSVTVGYADFLSEDEQLPDEAREHAQRAMESALAATRAVTAFRNSLGCGPGSLQLPEDVDLPTLARYEPGDDDPWRYDGFTHAIRSRDGRPLAVLTNGQGEQSQLRNGRLMAQAPLLRDTLGETQHLFAKLLSGPTRSPEEVGRLRAALERINLTLERVDG